jgi:hypothetical protein
MPQWASGRKDDQGESGISPCPPQAPLRQSPKVELFSKTSCQKSRTNSLYTYHSFSYCICTLISHNSIYGLFKSSFQIDSCWFTASLFIPAAIRERLANARSIGLDSIRQKNKQRVRQSGFRWLIFCLTVSVLTVPTESATAAPTGSPLDYITLNYGGSGTFLTGIRGNNIVGNYVIAGTGETGGLL